MAADAGDDAERSLAADLAARITAGDRTAEEELVTRYSDMVARDLRYLLRNREVAEDLHQETFQIVLQRLRGRGLSDAPKLGAYLRRIARNLALAEIRRAARQHMSGDEHALAAAVDPAGDPLASILREEQTRRIRRALDHLSRGRDRELLSRFYLAEEDRESIRRDLGVTTLHFNRLLFRARRRLGRILESLQASHECRTPERGGAGERKVRR